MKSLWHRFLVWSGVEAAHDPADRWDYDHGYRWAKDALESGAETEDEMENLILGGSIADPYIRGAYEAYRQFSQARTHSP